MTRSAKAKFRQSRQVELFLNFLEIKIDAITKKLPFKLILIKCHAKINVNEKKKVTKKTNQKSNK